MLRATVVMAVATLDAFIRDLIIEEMPEVLRSQKADRTPFVDYISEKDKDGVRRIAASSNPSRQRMELLRSRLATESAQSVKAVSTLVCLTGISDKAFWIEIEKTLPKAKEQLERLAKRRHQIAHRNDIPSGKTVAEQINRPWVEQQSTFALKFAEATQAAVKRHTGSLKQKKRIRVKKPTP